MIESRICVVQAQAVELMRSGKIQAKTKVWAKHFVKWRVLEEVVMTLDGAHDALEEFEESLAPPVEYERTAFVEETRRKLAMGQGLSLELKTPR